MEEACYCGCIIEFEDKVGRIAEVGECGMTVPDGGRGQRIGKSKVFLEG